MTKPTAAEEAAIRRLHDGGKSLCAIVRETGHSPWHVKCAVDPAFRARQNDLWRRLRARRRGDFVPPAAVPAAPVDEPSAAPPGAAPLDERIRELATRGYRCDGIAALTRAPYRTVIAVLDAAGMLAPRPEGRP